MLAERSVTGLIPRARIGDPAALRVSVVIPAYDEGENIAGVLERIFESVTLPGETLVVVDDAADRTRPVVQRLARPGRRLRCLVNTYGPGPANAIRYGIDHATSPVAVVTMADGCDDVGRSTTWSAWSSAAWRSRPRPGTCPAASSSAGRG